MSAVLTQVLQLSSYQYRGNSKVVLAKYSVLKSSVSLALKQNYCLARYLADYKYPLFLLVEVCDVETVYYPLHSTYYLNISYQNGQFQHFHTDRHSQTFKLKSLRYILLTLIIVDLIHCYTGFLYQYWAQGSHP